jgi:hypothetical protein
MSRYLISFNVGTMDVAEEDLPAVGGAAKAVVQEAQAAGVLVFAGGVGDPREITVVGRDGAATQGAPAGRAEFIGGMTVVDVPSRADALAWAERIAAACRCPQDVREFMAGSLP